MGEDSTIYVGSNENMMINCGGESGCEGTVIYSDNVYSDNFIGNLWEINCIYTNSPGSCDNFWLHFADYSCLSEWDGTKTINNCTTTATTASPITSNVTVSTTTSP